MSTFLQTLTPLLSTILVVVLALAAPARGQGDVNSFAYNFNGNMQPSTLSYEGDAHFASDTTYLVMTRTRAPGTTMQFSVGRALHTPPIKFWESGAQVDFDTTFKFIIKPNPGDDNPADGFTFFIGPVGLPLGFTGGSFGIFDRAGRKPSVFAAEFDIFINADVDPNYRHIGIDIESNVSENTTEVGAEFLIGHEVTAHVSYRQGTKLITVSAWAGERSFEVSYVFDLRAILPERVQVGISAATGGEVAVHELISWYFTSILVSEGDVTPEKEGGAAGIRQSV